MYGGRRPTGTGGTGGGAPPRMCLCALFTSGLAPSKTRHRTRDTRIVSLDNVRIVSWGQELHISSNPYERTLLHLKNKFRGGTLINDITSVIR